MAMIAIELGIDTDAISEGLQRGWSVPTRYYWDPDIYQFEQDVIYGRSWQYIAPKVKLSRPGDCVVGQAGHTPIVITCGEDGRIRGFVNVCRHRGHPVVGNDGSCTALVCPYHGWTYHLDGTLKRAPETQNEPEFQQDDLMVLSQIIPLAPGLTRSIMDYFGERGSDSGRVESWVALWDQTFREDLDAARRQHQGLRSGRVAHSRFVTTREQPLIFINQLICDAYRQGLDAR